MAGCRFVFVEIFHLRCFWRTVSRVESFWIFGLDFDVVVEFWLICVYVRVWLRRWLCCLHDGSVVGFYSVLFVLFVFGLVACG